MASVGEVEVNISGESKELIRTLNKTAKAFEKFARKIEKDAEQSAKKVQQSYIKAFKVVDKATGARTRIRVKGTQGAPPAAPMPKMPMSTFNMGRGDPFNRSTQEFTKGLGKGLSQLTSKLGPAAAGLAAFNATIRGFSAFAVHAVEQSKQFEQGLANVRAITSGTSRDFDILSSAVQAVSINTEHSNISLLEAAEVFGRAGFKAKEIGLALQTTADLATAAGLDIAKAANLSIRILKSFGMELSNLRGVADVLAKASASANVSIQSLGEGFKFAGAIASTVGLQFEDVVTALSLLGETGLEAGLAGRAFQAMLMNLAKPTERATKKLLEFGVVTHDVDGNMLSMTSILGQLAQANMTAGDSFQIFNSNAARAVTALTRNISKYKEFNRELKDANGAINEQSKIMRETLSVSLKELGNNFDTFAKNVGDALAPVIDQELKKITKLINLFNFFVFDTKLPDALARPGDKGPPVELADPKALADADEAKEAKRLEEAKKAKLEEIKKSISSAEIVKDALKTLSEKFQILKLEGTDAIKGFDVKSFAIDTIVSTFEGLKATLPETMEKADGTVLEIYKEAFKNSKRAIEAALGSNLVKTITDTQFRINFNEALRKFIPKEAPPVLGGMGGTGALVPRFDINRMLLDTAEDFFGAIGASAVGSSKLGGLIASFQSGGFIGAFINLMENTEGFQAVLVPLNNIFESLVAIVEPLMEPLFYVALLFKHVAKVLETILVPVFEFLGAVLTMFAKAIAGLANLFIAIANFFISIANFFGANYDMVEPFKIEGEYEKTLESLNDKTKDTRDGFEDLNEELLDSANVAAGFKLNLRAFQAALGANVSSVANRSRLRMHAGGVVPGVGMGDAIPAMLTPGETVIPRGGAAGGVVIQTLHVHVADTKDFMRKLTREEEFQNLVRTGSPIKGKLAGIR